MTGTYWAAMMAARWLSFLQKIALHIRSFFSSFTRMKSTEFVAKEMATKQLHQQLLTNSHNLLQLKYPISSQR